MRTTSGTLRGLERDADGWWRVELVPRRASLLGPSTVTVEAARGPASARASIRLTQPIPWLTIGLDAGVQTNAGALLGPAGRVEIATRVGLARGWLEIGVQSGLSFARMTAEIPRGTSEIDLFTVPVSVALGYALNLRSRLSMGLSVTGGALVVSVSERSTFQADASRLEVAPSVEALLHTCVRLGRGEIVVRAGFGWATSSEGSGLAGNLLGLVVLAGYRVSVL